jgi:nicotinamidase-related amidase
MMKRTIKGTKVLICMIGIALPTAFLPCNAPAQAGAEETILEVWDTIKAPPRVDLKAVKVEPTKSAFLVLDIEQLTCNAERRPRCVASVPKIRKFLEKARAKGLTVVYSLTSRGTRETILPGVTPLGTEPVVKSSVDKFYRTDLQQILRERGVTTVIIAGTTAEGAVLHTATGASMRGFQVIVPIDGMSAATLYAEQYTAWHLVNAPGSRRRTTLTRFDMIEF